MDASYVPAVHAVIQDLWLILVCLMQLRASFVFRAFSHM